MFTRVGILTSDSDLFLRMVLLRKKDQITASVLSTDNFLIIIIYNTPKDTLKQFTNAVLKMSSAFIKYA